MNRNVVFGAGLATLLVGATLVLAGGAKTSNAPAPVEVKGAPLPSLEPMIEADAKPASATPKPESQPSSHQAPSHP